MKPHFYRPVSSKHLRRADGVRKRMHPADAAYADRQMQLRIFRNDDSANRRLNLLAFLFKILPAHPRTQQQKLIAAKANQDIDRGDFRADCRGNIPQNGVPRRMTERIDVYKRQSYSHGHLNMNIVQYDYSHLPASCQEGFSSFILLDFGIEKSR